MNLLICIFQYDDKYNRLYKWEATETVMLDISKIKMAAKIPFFH